MIADRNEMPSIQLTDVSKTIKETTVLDGINLRLEGGKVYALTGRNGSGKTMLLRLLAGLIAPTTGEILYGAGLSIGIEDLGARIGITVENTTFYPRLTGLENLLLLSSINGYIGALEVRATMDRVGLDPDDKRILKKYSLGMKQRLSIAQAIMENPDYILLDEPTNALDAEGIRRIQKVIQGQAARGAVIVVASHSAEDIDLLCDRIYELEDGKIIAEREKGAGRRVEIG